MSMFCYQCQETSRNLGCTMRGVCGKSPELCHLLDLSIHAIKGLAYVSVKLLDKGVYHKDDALIVMGGLFRTITNANWDEEQIKATITNVLTVRDLRKKELCDLLGDACKSCPDVVTFTVKPEDYEAYGQKVGVLATENEDVRSLRETIIYGIKGISAYGEHAWMLGYISDEVNKFVMEGMAATVDDSLSAEQLTGLVIKTGEHAVKVMELLDKANTETYGVPEPTVVQLGVGKNPGIIVSGHDLKDFEELLQQTEGRASISTPTARCFLLITIPPSRNINTSMATTEAPGGTNWMISKTSMAPFS